MLAPITRHVFFKFLSLLSCAPTEFFRGKIYQSENAIR